MNLKEHIKKNSTVIIGVSGGPDSVFLSDKCLKLQKKHPFRIVIAHVNYNLRKADSLKDEKFVHDLAQKNDCPFECIRLSRHDKGNLEENCRNARYKFFEQLRKEYKADWILTAHHLNDNIETILLNIVRGSFVDGLSGMTVTDTKRHLLRPLLFMTKDEIMINLKKRKMKFRKDKTNNDTRFSRNLIRHKVIPSLKNINKNLEQTFAQNIPMMQELKSHLDKNTSGWIKKNSNTNGIKLDSFTKLDPIMQKNTLFHLYKKTYGNTKKFSKDHLNQIIGIINKNYANRKKEFGDTHFIKVARSKKDNNKYIQILKK